MSSNERDDLNFDFMTDAEFRASLEADYRELSNCMEKGAWKGVHVLAGSIVEAILTDYLLGTDYQKKTGTDPLKMELGPIIAACKNEKIITDRTADLSAVVRSYRNLIHPGRVVRLSETVDSKTASIAKALVEVIVSEVAAKKKQSYGFTAEQIINKIAKDNKAIALLTHFLRETSDRERERLAKDVIPDRYFQEQENQDYSNSIDYSDYQTFHRQVFNSLSDDAKANVAKRFIKILREGSGEYVIAYENLFFRASDLKYLASNDASLAKTHLLARLNEEPAGDALDVMDGLGKFLTKDEIDDVIGQYVRAVAYAKVNVTKEKADELLHGLNFETEGEVNERMKKRLDDWITFFEQKQLEEAKAALERIKSDWADEIPF